MVSGLFILLCAFWISIEIPFKTEAMEDKQHKKVQKTASNI